MLEMLGFSSTDALKESQKAVHVVKSPLNLGSSNFGRCVLACATKVGGTMTGWLANGPLTTEGVSLASDNDQFYTQFNLMLFVGENLQEIGKMHCRSIYSNRAVTLQLLCC